jgi:hypothetical protein
MLQPQAPSRLQAHSVHPIEDGAGHNIKCLAGTLWLTQENDPRDIILSPGQSFTLDRPGKAVLVVLGSRPAWVAWRTRQPARGRSRTESASASLEGSP